MDTKTFKFYRRLATTYLLNNKQAELEAMPWYTEFVTEFGKQQLAKQIKIYRSRGQGVVEGGAA
jgi:hypothetical protein